MRCIECRSAAVTERPERTAQGYGRFRRRACGKPFNERSGTVLNRAQYPSHVIALVVLSPLRYKLALRDLPEMFAQRSRGAWIRARAQWVQESASKSGDADVDRASQLQHAVEGMDGDRHLGRATLVLA
jgi:hypothetical protein